MEEAKEIRQCSKCSKMFETSHPTRDLCNRCVIDAIENSPDLPSELASEFADYLRKVLYD